MHCRLILPYLRLKRKQYAPFHLILTVKFLKMVPFSYMSQPTLYLMLGYPGAGKTTAAKLIHELNGAVHLWGDHERRLNYPEPTYSHEETRALYDDLNYRAEQLLADGQSVI